MASDLSTRPGCTVHSLTIHSEDQMRHLVDHTDRFQSKQAG